MWNVLYKAPSTPSPVLASGAVGGPRFVEGLLRCRTKRRAVNFAQEYCSAEGRSATIHKLGKIVMRYWRDEEGLQYLEY